MAATMRSVAVLGAGTMGAQIAAHFANAGVPVARGRFGAEMAVELVNDGPFTIWLDTADR